MGVTGDLPRDEFREHLQHAIAPAYEIQRELTGGGMSRVFVATETALQREVVIKVLPPELAAGVNRERFRREIQLAAALQHPHIVPLLSAGESGELLYYTMPFIRGESLKSAVERGGALPVREVVQILHDVVDALAYAHEHGVIHRDIKPANVLMSGTHAVITDFGVAKALSVALGPIGVTTSGVVIGTPAYMAPEQLAGDPAADQRIDIYAVGLLAYELLTGSSPFADRSSPQATMAAQLTEMPPPLDERVAELPRALSSLIMRCLEKSPDLRPSSARELLATLDDVTTPNGGVRLSDVPVGRAPSRRVVAALSAVTTIAVVSALALTLTRRMAIIPETAPPAAPADTTRIAASAAKQQGAPTLTHADSLAIAAAVEKRVEDARRKSAVQPRGAATLDLDSLRTELEHALADSMSESFARARALRGLGADSARFRGIPGAAYVPNLPNIDSIVRGSATWTWRPDSAATRRVAVAAQLTVGGLATLAPAARAMADSLRAHLAAAGYDVVTSDSGRPSRYQNADPLRLARTSRAGIGISGIVIQQGDTVSYVLMIGDLRRGQNVRTFTGGRAPIAEPLRDAGRFAAFVTNWLNNPRP